MRSASPPASAAVSSTHVSASAGSPRVHTMETGGTYGRIGCAPSTVSITPRPTTRSADERPAAPSAVAQPNVVPVVPVVAAAALTERPPTTLPARPFRLFDFADGAGFGVFDNRFRVSEHRLDVVHVALRFVLNRRSRQLGRLERRIDQ